MWQNCVLLFTFSDITRGQEYPSVDDEEEYKAFLRENPKQFQDNTARGGAPGEDQNEKHIRLQNS